jgi:hypothetical protein
VVAGLTKDDLVVTEEKKRQRIFSCETPEARHSGRIRSYRRGRVCKYAHGL